MRMEEIMLFFSDLQKSELFTNELYLRHLSLLQANNPNELPPPLEEEQAKEFELVRRFKRMASEILIENKLLTDLKEEYDQIQKEIKFWI